MSVAAGTPGDFAGLGRTARSIAWLIVWLALAALRRCSAWNSRCSRQSSWIIGHSQGLAAADRRALNYLMREIFVPVFKPLFRALRSSSSC